MRLTDSFDAQRTFTLLQSWSNDNHNGKTIFEILLAPFQKYLSSNNVIAPAYINEMEQQEASINSAIEKKVNPHLNKIDTAQMSEPEVLRLKSQLECRYLGALSLTNEKILSPLRTINMEQVPEGIRTAVTDAINDTLTTREYEFRHPDGSVIRHRWLRAAIIRSREAEQADTSNTLITQTELDEFYKQVCSSLCNDYAVVENDFYGGCGRRNPTNIIGSDMLAHFKIKSQSGKTISLLNKVIDCMAEVFNLPAPTATLCRLLTNDGSGNSQGAYHEKAKLLGTPENQRSALRSEPLSPCSSGSNTSSTLSDITLFLKSPRSPQSLRKLDAYVCEIDVMNAYHQAVVYLKILAKIVLTHQNLLSDITDTLAVLQKKPSLQIQTTPPPDESQTKGADPKETQQHETEILHHLWRGLQGTLLALENMLSELCECVSLPEEPLRDYEVQIKVLESSAKQLQSTLERNKKSLTAGVLIYQLKACNAAISELRKKLEEEQAIAKLVNPPREPSQAKSAGNSPRQTTKQSSTRTTSLRLSLTSIASVNSKKSPRKDNSQNLNKSDLWESNRKTGNGKNEKPKLKPFALTLNET